MRRSWPWHLLCPPACLLAQGLPLLLIPSIYHWAYTTPSALSDSLELTLSRVVLGIAAGGSAGIYLCFVRSRLPLALAMLTLFSVPAIIAGAIYLFALLWLLWLA